MALAKDAKIKFSDLEYFSYSKILESSDFMKMDTLTKAKVRWKTALSDSIVTLKEKELTEWLKQQLNSDKISVEH